jgi:serine/threonine protein kinase
MRSGRHRPPKSIIPLDALLYSSYTCDRYWRHPANRTDEPDITYEQIADRTPVTGVSILGLTPGIRLGRYEVLSPAGAGGMGEVYKARDTRLDRIVAIKILPGISQENASLRQRFEREAKAISSLNHANICTLHDVGHQDGVDYLVLEFLEGETLSTRLKRGALSTEDFLRYAIEITDALDRAHRQGIIHRDLKPGNIMLTKSGAKILDFGLAKLGDVSDARRQK